MKIALKVIGIVVGLAAVGLIVLVAIGSARLSSGLDVPVHDVPSIATDSAALAEGARLAQVFACTECHGGQLEGMNFLDGGPFMTLPAPNLTGGRFTDLELERAIRHGVGADARALLIMPTEAFVSISDYDLSRVMGYIQSLPAVETTLIRRSIGPVGRAVGAFQASTLQPARTILHRGDHVAVSPEPGEYFGTMCAACHGSDLGGRMFTAEQPIWAPNLTDHSTGLGSWSEEDFDAAMRRGRRPDGRELNPAAMPWRGFAGLRDSEVAAIWSYLKSLPPVDRSDTADD